MTYSLATAAAATGTVKSTILRAIMAGKVSATRNDHGQWVIEPAELHRVYPPATAGNGAGAGAGNGTHRKGDSGALAEAHQRAAWPSARPQRCGRRSPTCAASVTVGRPLPSG